MPVIETPRPAPNHRLWGALAVIPAVLLLCSGYVLPTLRTFWTSLHNASFFKEIDAEFVGLDNYGRLFDIVEIGPIFTVIGLAVAGTFVAVVLGGGLAYLAHRGGGLARRAVVCAFALPMAALAPAAIAAAWSHAVTGRLATPFPDDLRPGFGTIAFLSAFGLLVGVGATAYLLVWRAPRGALPGAGLVALTLGAAVFATSLQSFAFPLLFARGPERPPAMVLYQVGFQQTRLGIAAALGFVLLVILGLVGLAVAVAVVLLRARVERVEDPAAAPPVSAAPWQTGQLPAGAQAAPSAQNRTPWLAGAVVAGAVLLLISLVGLSPWLIGLLDFGPVRGDGVLKAMLLTWLPPLLSTLLGVGAGIAAGFGISALRPLGERSELLLLVFAPWLFVGLLPFAPDAFQHIWRHDDDTFLWTFLRLIPPSSLSIPALFLSAVLFRGLAAQLGPARSLKHAAPVLGLIALITWVVAAQDALWPLLAIQGGKDATLAWLAISDAFRLGYAGRGAETILGWVLPIPGWLLLVAAIAVVQVFVLDKLALRTGRTDTTP